MKTAHGDEVGLRGYRVVDAARSARRRTQVLEAGARVFSRKTYGTATMDDIAQELGVSKGVVYYQFRSKEDIFREIIVTAISEALRRLIATDARGGSPDERLREAIDRSREMYDKRVQPPVAAKFDYFHYELVSNLAEGDANRLGASYPGADV